MKKQQRIENLFLAVRKYYLNCGRTEDTASLLAYRIAKKSEKLRIKDIKIMIEVLS